MKRGVFLLVLLLCISTVSAASLYDYDQLVLELEVDGSFDLIPTQSGGTIKQVKTNLLLFPKDNFRQTIVNIDTEGIVEENHINYIWTDKRVEEKQYGYEATVQTKNKRNKVSKKIAFPISKEKLIGFEQYTEPTETIDSNDINIIKMASELAEGEDDLFKVSFKLAEWVEYELQIANYDDAPEKIKKFSDLILKRYKLKKLNFTKTEQIVPYVDQMFYLLGKTYDKLQTFVPIQDYQIDHYKNRFLKYINPGFIKCVTDENDDLVAFAITMPSFSNALKKINGKVDLIGKLRLLHAKNYNHKGSLYLIGVRPDFQNKGVIAILFNELQKFYNKFGITEVETNPELIENAAIQQLWKNYENNQHKNRATFTKVI